MKKDTFVEEFCRLTERAEKEIAPHVKQCLIKLENGELDELYEATNNPEKLIESIRSSEGFYQHLQTFNEYEKVIQSFSQSITRDGIKESLFNILRGIQHSYKREPYVPKGGIGFWDTIGKNSFHTCYYPSAIKNGEEVDGIAITAGFVSWVGFFDKNKIPALTPFASGTSSGNLAFFAGMEEQDHASDIAVRKIGYKKGAFKASGLKNGQYYTQDIEEMTAALRRNDYAANNKLPWTEKSQKPTTNSLKK